MGDTGIPDYARTPSKFHQSKWFRKPIECRKNSSEECIIWPKASNSYKLLLLWVDLSNILSQKIGSESLPWCRPTVVLSRKARQRSWVAKHLSFDCQWSSTWDERRFWKLGRDDSGVTMGYKAPGFLTGKAMWLLRPFRGAPKQNLNPWLFYCWKCSSGHSFGSFVY